MNLPDVLRRWDGEPVPRRLLDDWIERNATPLLHPDPDRRIEDELSQILTAMYDWSHIRPPEPRQADGGDVSLYVSVPADDYADVCGRLHAIVQRLRRERGDGAALNDVLAQMPARREET